MKSTDGKFYATDVADQEQLFRLVQSIPSPKVEPIKLWIARVASERIDEMIDPEVSIDRAINTYRRKGYSGVSLSGPAYLIASLTGRLSTTLQRRPAASMYPWRSSMASTLHTSPAGMSWSAVTMPSTPI